MSKKMGRRPKPLDPKSLGARIRKRRDDELHLTSEVVGGWVRVSSQQITNTEQKLAAVLNGTYKFEDENKGKGYSDQLIVSLAQELGDDFGEPQIAAHLKAWLRRVVEMWGLEIREILNPPNTGNGDDDSSPPPDPPDELMPTAGSRTPPHGSPKDVVAGICSDLEFQLHRSDLRDALEEWINQTRLEWEIDPPQHEIKDIREIPSEVGHAIPDVQIPRERPPGKQRSRKRR